MNSDPLDVVEIAGTKLPLRLKNLFEKFDRLCFMLGDRAPRSVRLFTADYSNLHEHVRHVHGDKFGAKHARWRGFPIERRPQ
jgi:hypothetical protein